MPYISVPLEPIIEIPQIVTIHYFEYSNDFSFDGEAHNFWEFLCVDKGEVEVVSDMKCRILSRGDIIFHKPNEFHRLTANHKIAPNLVVIAFCCDSPAMDFFRDRLLVIDDYERFLLAEILKEARNAFWDPLDNPFQTRMRLRDDAPVGSAQMIRLHLELLLLHLLRRSLIQPIHPDARETIRRQKDEEQYHRILSYMSDHLSEQLTMEQISRQTLIGKSRLQQLIARRHDCGVIELFSRLKIEEAKQLIRNNQLNFTEISDTLGYSSIHYFSRQFKKLTGMTPSEYSSSIKGLSEKKES